MEEMLIEKVREHEILYNTWSLHYRDQNMRQKAWQEIGKELTMTPEDVKNIWEKLRRCFINALSRRRAKFNDACSKPIPAWKFEKQMSFLLPFYQSRKNQSNSADNKSTDEADIEHEGDIKEDFIIKEQFHNSISEDTESETISNGDVETSISMHEIKKPKRTDNDDTLKETPNISKENTILPKRKFKEDHTHEDWADMDETDMFFVNMSKMTKRLPLIEQAKIKKLLSNAVLDAQIKLLEDQQNLSPRSSFPHSFIVLGQSTNSTF